MRRLFPSPVANVTMVIFLDGVEVDVVSLCGEGLG